MAARDPMMIPRRTPALVTDRTVAFDAGRGVYILKATRTLARPPLVQVEVWRRHDRLRDFLAAHGYPMPPVRWVRETLSQRRTRLARRKATRLQWAEAAVRLEGALS